MARRREVVDTVTAPGEEPRREGVGVPHVARPLLVAAPRAGGEVRGELEHAPGVLRVITQSPSAADRLGEIGDHAVTPAVHLVAEET